MAKAPKGWQPVGLVQPPLRADILVWNGKSRSMAQFKRGRFVARADGADMCGPDDRAWVVHGVTHWAHLTDPP